MSATIANAKRGRMQCAFCRETFGPAHSFAQRLESDDRWSDPVVAAQHAKVVAHVWKEHPKTAAIAFRPRSAFDIPDALDNDPERDRFLDHNDVTEEIADA